jgi:hypothetical protein
MRPNFEKCVRAIADTLIRQEMPSVQQLNETAAVAAFLLESHARMPDYLRVVFKCLTVVFDCWPCLLTGKPFHAQSYSRRLDQINRWGASRLQFRNTLITFFKTLTTFGLYANIYKQDYAVGSHSKQD